MQINPEKFQNYRSDYHNLATSDDDNVPIVLATIQYQTEEGENGFVSLFRVKSHNHGEDEI